MDNINEKKQSILNNLKEEIPESNSNWMEISTYALEFNAYEYWKDKELVFEIADKCRKDYFNNGSLPDRKDYLRTDLFALQRSIRFASRDGKPHKEDWDYINAILDKLREIKRKY